MVVLGRGAVSYERGAPVPLWRGFPSPEPQSALLPAKIDSSSERVVQSSTIKLASPSNWLSTVGYMARILAMTLSELESILGDLHLNSRHGGPNSQLKRLPWSPTLNTSLGALCKRA